VKKIQLFILLVVSTVYVFAQANLDISLLDSLNQPVAFQLIAVSNPAIGFEKGSISDEYGQVKLNGLSTSGSYTVTVAANSFYQGKTISGIVLISDKTTSVTLSMRAITMGLEAVVISADNYQVINTFDAQVSSELTSKEIEQMPVEGRDITRTLYRLPNITQATGFFPEAPTIAINGANALYTNYQIDGMDNNENFLGGQRFAMPVGFTKNITALTNNFSVEHGLTSNGIINITTKSGTNETTGEFFYITRPGPAIDASSPYAQRDISGNQVKDGFQRHQTGLAAGGALVREKTYYFINVEHTTDIKDNLLNVPQLNINETVRGVNNFTYVSAKLDQHWSDRFRSSLRINTGIINVERQGGGLEGGTTFPSAGNQQDRNSLNIALKNTYRGENLTYESNYQYGRFRWNYANPVSNTSPDVTILDPSGVNMAFIGHPGYVFDENENTHVIQQKLTLRKGSHQIKTGGQIRSSGFTLFGGGNPNGRYLVQLNQTQLDQLIASQRGSSLSPADLPADVQVLNYGVELRPSAFEGRQNIYSVYLEDQWSINARFNLNFGLRYDYDQLSKGGSDRGDRNNMAPRISANYKLNDKTSFRAGYGIYYDKILYAVYSDAIQFNSTASNYGRQLEALRDLGILPAVTEISQITNEGNLVANDPNASYLQGPSADQLQDQRANVFQNELRVLNPDGYENPNSRQFMLGIQRKLNDQTIMYIDAMYNQSQNLFRLRNLNAPAAYRIDPENVVARTTTQADGTRPIPIYTDARGGYTIIDADTLRGVARNVVMTETEGESNYYALNFTLQKSRGQDNYALRLMYTLSYLENNTEDINFRAMDSNQFEEEWGPSINDRTHLLNGIVNYYPIKHLSMTLAGLLQSGQPINRIPDATLYGTTDLNGDGQAFGDAYVGNSDRSPGEARNNDRLPWSTTFDLSTFYVIPFSQKIDAARLEIGAQIFNLLNAENLSGYANNATQSNQIQTGPAASGLLIRRNAAPPRQFQFSIRYLF
jgi:hypothetical protein